MKSKTLLIHSITATFKNFFEIGVHRKGKRLVGKSLRITFAKGFMYVLEDKGATLI